MLRGHTGLEVAAHERRTPQKSDKIKGSSLPRPLLLSLPRMGSKIKVKNVSMEGTDERLIINFRAAIQHFLKCKFDAQKWHIMISRSNKGEWVQEGLLLRDRLERSTYSRLYFSLPLPLSLCANLLSELRRFWRSLRAAYLRHSLQSASVVLPWKLNL